jgi:SAM-dependent methyltransferase
VAAAILTRLRTWLDTWLDTWRNARLDRLRARLLHRRQDATLSRSPARPDDSHPFDHRHRVDTAGLFYADQLASGHHRDAHSAGYYATAPSLVRGALQQWTLTLLETGLTLADFALLDVGCGKGRVLLIASEYPFRRIVGVELHPGLVAIARRNLRRWMRRPRACTNVEVLQDDALAIPLPEGPLLVFFFNSFEREMIDPFLHKIAAAAAARPDPIDLIYVHPEFGSIVGRHPRVRLLSDLELTLTPEDAAADIFGVAWDRVAIYRFTPPRPPASRLTPGSLPPQTQRAQPKPRPIPDSRFPIPYSLFPTITHFFSVSRSADKSPPAAPAADPPTPQCRPPAESGRR